MQKRPGRTSSWLRAAALTGAAALAALAAAGGIIAGLRLEVVTASLFVGPLLGLLVGSLLGRACGRKGFLLPPLLIVLLLAAGRLEFGVAFGAGAALLLLTLPLFSAAGVLLGGWLSDDAGRAGAGETPFVYGHALFAVALSGLCAGFIGDQVRSLLPSAWAAPPALPGAFAAAGRVLAYAGLLVPAALVWWLRPVQRFLSGRHPDAKAAARARAERLPYFLAVLGAAWALPRIAGGIVLSATLASPAPLFRYALPAAAEAYYLAYLCLLYFEPYLFTRVTPRLHAGDELYARKDGPALSIRLRLWLMVLNLVVLPMLLIAASLIEQHSSLAAVWPLPLVVLIVALCWLVGYCEVLYQSITRPLDELARKMEAVAGGDLTVRTSVLSSDELGRIKSHFNGMVEGLAERERLRDTFGRYVSVEVAKQLLRSGRIELGGESITATVLFSDIRDFTPMSERMPPQELVAFLNRYFSYITEPVAAHRGVVNKFIGDAVMAIFAPQFGSAEHAADGVRAALAMRERLAAFNAGGFVPHPVRFGVGIHTGVLVAGNIGTEKRLEYTVIGDTVNIASRIESQTKTLGCDLLMSDAVHAALPEDLRAGLRAERCEGVRVKGKESALVLYKLL
ncbi:MAG: adenylate/guanylate cyclase domain-containing protein [Elusimicrobiota bacterium]|jgi:class 3 adenylate cyclase